ncbi:UNVERIFIED_CONTAM: hypothetical protein GTU68_062599 [Idotea baltica]|nr:hypothetical protein [Idotea baltica]
MNNVVVYSKDPCPYCDRAKLLLQSKGVQYDSIDIGHDDSLATKIMQVTQQRSVPQIFVNNSPIGGFDSLARLNASGELDRLLNTG